MVSSGGPQPPVPGVDRAGRRAGHGPRVRPRVDAARAAEEQFRLEIDGLALSTFENGNLDQLLAVVSDTTGAQADAAAARALSAAAAAALAEQDVEARKRDAGMLIEEAERLLERLSPQQRSDRLGPDVDVPGGPVRGSGAGVVALRAAITQLGRPYRRGAEGPSSVDCSGLTSWGFSEAGVTLPRSSSQQARVGQAVARDDLRPVGHVGIHGGAGKMISAPLAGDVVTAPAAARDLVRSPGAGRRPDPPAAARSHPRTTACPVDLQPAASGRRSLAMDPRDRP